jgi:hypothetical protein
MSTGLFDARPPFVRFEEREYGINHEASEKAGRPIPRIVTMVCITSHGSKDCHEKLADEWFAQIKVKALNGQFPVAWLDMFKLQYEEWKKGHELPREGTPTRTWSAVNKEQQARLSYLPMTKTVEDLAQVPDMALGEIGLDGRHLRDLARNWIAEGKDKGINSRKLADAELALEQLRHENGELRQRLVALEQAQSASQPRARKGQSAEGAAA